jgi:hypothetical protein
MVVRTEKRRTGRRRLIEFAEEQQAKRKGRPNGLKAMADTLLSIVCTPPCHGHIAVTMVY